LAEKEGLDPPGLPQCPRRVNYFYLRALIEERIGSQTDWNAVDSLMLKALAAAEKVARCRHAQLSAIKLAGDINATTVSDDATLDELLVKIREELRKLGPLIDLESIREQQGVENRLPVTANGSEAG
jgi:hypothetical protein